MAYNPEMEKLRELQLLKQKIAGQQQTAPQVPVQAPMAAPQVPVQAPMAAPQVPVQAPMAAAPAQAQQAKPSFFQRLGQRFDQAATGGIIDPTTLTKDQRRILRGQFLMNVGGALSQNRPIGEGFQQQYNMLTKRKAEEQALQAKRSMAEAFAGGIGNREQFMGVVQNLFSQGMVDQGMELLSKADDLFPRAKYSTEPRIFTRRDTGESFVGVLSDDGNVKTLDGIDIPAEEVFIPVSEGGAVFRGEKGGSGINRSTSVTPVIARPKTRKVVDVKTGPNGTKYVQYEDGSVEKQVD